MFATFLKFMALLTGISFIWQVRSLILGYASERWATTKGQLIERYVDDMPTLPIHFGLVPSPEASSEDGFHSASVRYSYRARFQDFESRRLSFQPTKYILFSTAMSHLADMRPGDDVEVYFDPKHPSRSVLIPGVSEDNVIRTVLAFVLFCASMWYVTA